jgi:hypothetical protein
MQNEIEVTEQQVEFCKDICMAAARMGLMIHESNPTENGTMFQWFDPAPSLLIKGPFNKNRKLALHAACESLVTYLNRPL